MPKRPGKYMKILGFERPHQVWDYLPKWASGMREEERNARSAILDMHAVIEDLLKTILYEKVAELIWQGPDNTPQLTQKRKKSVKEAVSRFSFGALYALLKPALDSFDEEQLAPIRSIQKARNTVAHRSVSEVRYKGKNPCVDCNSLAQLYYESWVAICQLQEFISHRIVGWHAEIKAQADFYHRHALRGLGGNTQANGDGSS